MGYLLFLLPDLAIPATSNSGKLLWEFPGLWFRTNFRVAFLALHLHLQIVGLKSCSLFLLAL